MFYSRWRPHEGGYDYFESDEEHNLNDDLPTPQLEDAGGIGVPSIEAGRPIPTGAVYVGSGEQAVDVIAPVERGRLVKRAQLGLSALSNGVPWGPIIVGTVIGYGIWYFAGKPTFR